MSEENDSQEDDSVEEMNSEEGRSEAPSREILRGTIPGESQPAAHPHDTAYDPTGPPADTHDDTAPLGAIHLREF
jgi:hypothetical protein